MNKKYLTPGGTIYSMFIPVIHLPSKGVQRSLTKMSSSVQQYVPAGPSGRG